MKKISADYQRYNMVVESIKLIASPPNVQLSIFPDYVCKPDEIALTLDEVLDNREWLTYFPENIIEKVMELNDSFDNFKKEEWSDEAVRCSTVWNNTRKKAIKILEELQIDYTMPNLFWIGYIEVDK